MEVVLVKKWCDIDNLTQNNSWKIIYDKLREEVTSDTDVMLDFKGINVVEPWTHDAFGEILKMRNVHFRFTSCNKEALENFVNKIKMKCIIEGLMVDRIESVYIEPIKPKTKEEIRIEKIGNGFLDKFSIEDNVATIEMNKIYDQIGSVETVEGLIYAVRKLNETNEIKEFIVKIGRMFVQSNMLELLAKYIIELDDKDEITLKIDTDKEEYAKELGLHIYSAINESYDNAKKIKNFLQVKNGTPGMLVKYKASRAVDQFGRNGKGQVVLNRVSLYRGVAFKESHNNLVFFEVDKIKPDGVEAIITVEDKAEKKEKKIKRFIDYSDIYVIIDSFHNDKFITHAEWMTRNDGEIVDEEGNEITTLPFDRNVISMDKLGLMDKFLGMQYHFIRAVQKSPEDSKSIIVDIDDNGGCITKKVTIPERMDIVLRDWGVKFNTLEMIKAIEDTNKILNK